MFWKGKTSGQKKTEKIVDDEHALLEAVALGDKVAFERLYLAYHRRLNRLLMRFFDRYGLIEEIINDTMLVVWQKAHTFEQRSKVSTWIMGIAYRRAMKTFKRMDRIHEREQEAGELECERRQEKEQYNRDDQNQWLRQGMESLNYNQRMSVELAYFGGHSCEEIADIMSAPVGTVKTRLHEARKKLRSTLPPLAEPNSA